jgi:hypothetical protein
MKRGSILGGLLLAPLVLLVAGCNIHPFSTPYAAYGDAPANSLRGQCERAAYDDPAVKEQVAKSAGMVSAAQAEGSKELAAVKNVVVQRCMNQRGGRGGGGGVELPNR